MLYIYILSFRNNIVKTLKEYGLFLTIFLLLILLLTMQNHLNAQTLNQILKEDVTFTSEGVGLSGTIYKAKQSYAAVVIVHGSGQEKRMGSFAEILAIRGISVLTYDKRGVGESGGIYAGPEVGTNNIDSININLLAKDASAAVNMLHQQYKNTPIGIVGFSQAGWIIPIATNQNSFVEFMVLFSCPTVSTLEQLRFQFYTAGRADFWDNHTETDTREHVKNDPDRYQFTGTDPKVALSSTSIPGLWLFGEKDIQIPVKMCIEKINALKVQGKPFEYALFPTLGHSTAFANDTAPLDISIQWIKQKAFNSKKGSRRK
jgi:dienelactone hydrolase